MQMIDRAVLLFLIVVFAFTGVDKLLHYQGFVNALNNYQLIPRGFGSYLAMPIITVELTIAVGLMVEVWRSSAAILAALTMAAFTAVVASNSIYGDRGICGCWFTFTLATSTRSHLILNGLMIAMALVVWWNARSTPEAEPTRVAGTA